MGSCPDTDIDPIVSIYKDTHREWLVTEIIVELNLPQAYKNQPQEGKLWKYIEN